MPTATYTRDWDPDTDGDFPLTSTRFAGCREVVMSSEAGDWAGFCADEPRQIGKLIEGGEDTRRTIPARYVAMALLRPSEQEVASMAEAQTHHVAQADKVEAKRTALKSIKAKRDSKAPLTPADLELLADVVTGRL